MTKIMKATILSQYIPAGQTIPREDFNATITCSTDLPAECIGEVVMLTLQKAWRNGEDPAGCTVVLKFSTAEEQEEHALRLVATG